MLKTILVGLDGSDSGDAALELGIRWARRFDALLIGMGVVDEPGIHGAEETWLGEAYFRYINKRLAEDVRREVERTLERAALRCVEASVAFKPLQDVGTPHERILIDAQRYDLIIVGQQTHFRFGWEDTADDTLRRILAESPRPVVAVPLQLGPEGGPVLVAYDGSVPSARALFAFRSTGLDRGRSVVVVSAADDKVEAARRADRAVEYLGFHGIAAKAVALKGERKASELILEQVASTGAELLVMGAFGKSALRELFLGSNTRSVLKDCPVPVFLTH